MTSRTLSGGSVPRRASTIASGATHPAAAVPVVAAKAARSRDTSSLSIVMM